MTPQPVALAFSAWVAARPRGERARVHFVEDGRVEVWPVATIAYELWDHDVRLPDRAATILGLPPDATYAHAARLLWCLREDERLPINTYADACTALASLSASAFRRCYEAVDESIRHGPLGQGWPDDLGAIEAAA